MVDGTSKKIRKPREHFTEKLAQVLQVLDDCAVRDYEFNGAFSWERRRSVWCRSTALRVWVCGSYARGAMHCRDVDVVVEFEDEAIDGKRKGNPDGKHTTRAFWGAMRDVQFLVGRPEHNDSHANVAGDAILIWTPGMDWRSAIAGIPVSETAGRFERVTDVLPVERSRLGLEIGEAQELAHAFNAGVVTWRWVPFQPGRASARRTKDEADLLAWVEFKRGKQAQEVVGPLLDELRTLRGSLPRGSRRGPAWSFSYDGPMWCGYEVQMGTARLGVGWLRRNPVLKGFVAVPYIRKSAENGLWLIERGEYFESGMETYLEDLKRRGDAA